jgi:predicted dienelactone hydrolase
MSSSPLVRAQSAGPAAAQYRVITIQQITLRDDARQRRIPIKLYLPDANGPFPVIVFSHGALASKDDYSGLGEFWASHGYVSVHLSHADSIADSGFRRTLKEAISDPAAWPERPRDVSFVLDAMEHADRLDRRLTGKLDLGHVGVGGHSFGAYTASLVGGATVHLPGKAGPQGFADRRVSAIVMLSPQGEGRLGLTTDSWDHLQLPMLLMFGSLDFGPFGEPPAWRNEAFLRAPPGDKHDVELEGATHMRFAGQIATAGNRPDPIFQCVKLETLAFWDAYLKADPDARRHLVSRGLRACSPDAGRFASK